MSEIPERLKDTIELFESIPERGDRIEVLMSIADRFSGVPEQVATRPYAEEHRVKACESEAYVWSVARGDGTLSFYFAVENPQGISAMATAVVLAETLSGAPLEQVTAVPREIIYSLFGTELSMGKRMGLMGMVDMVKQHARKAMTERPAESE